MSPSPGNDSQFESLLAAAIDALERSGQPEVDRLLAEYPGHAAAVRAALGELAKAGVLAPPPPSGTFPARLGDFRLLERLGGGGMGVVFLAEQESLKRRVAVKLVRPELLLSEVARERFQREIEAVSQLQHPGIVPILAVGSEGGIPFFAMEYVSGQSLEQVLTAVAGRAPATLQGRDLASAFGNPTTSPGTGSGTPTGQITQGAWWEGCVRIVLAVAQTMAYVHARGIVHRDLKPSNIVLTPDGRALLLDFGLAHMQHNVKLTRTGAEVGSPAYMAPEQLRGEALDERTDVYSLGVTMYQMLALQLPFVGTSAEQLRQHIQAGTRRPLHTVNPSLPRELELIVHSAMELTPAHRYRTMEALAQDLVAALERRPIAARPLGLHLRLLRWCQRHRAMTAGLSVAAVLLLLFPLVLLHYQRLANEELGQALGQTKAVNQELDRARGLAEADYGEALSAIDRMLVRFAFDELVHVPATQPLRVAMLREAITFYERIVARHPDQPLPRIGRCRAQRHLASVLRDLGNTDEAITLASAAIAVLSGITDHIEALAESAFSHAVLAGIAMDQRRLQDCLTACDATAAACTRALALNRNHLPVRIAAAEVENLRGLAHAQLNNPVARDRHLRQALDLRRQIAAEHPDNVRATRALALQLLNVADTGLADRNSGADNLLREAIDLVRPLTTAASSAADRQQLASTISKLGLWHRQHRELAAAEPLLTEALQIRQAIAQEHPDTPNWLSEHASGLFNLGLLRHDQKRHAEAAELAERAYARLQDSLRLVPDDPRRMEPRAQILTLRCNSYMRLLRIDDLQAAAEELATIPDSPRRASLGAHFLMQAAFLLGKDTMLAAADREARISALEDRAMTLLVAAGARGLRDVRVLDGSAFKKLAGRSEFADLRKQVTANAADGR
ncbi:MAG: serine/threonine protein kinase [Planctomycetes bacterium]|nr:serine/threonine protein kinase [Planctomycetota bacterium]